MSDIAELLAAPCDCPDCESAVSPGAYLATLLDYVLKHVRTSGGAITIAALRDRLHQPFGELPLDCSAAETTVSQYRIAIEVLRAYVGARPLLGTARESDLTTAEERYLESAYLSLLAGAGTTYEEVRRARGAPEDERAALAARLGIALTPTVGGGPRNDEVDQLVRSTEVPPGDPLRLTEAALDRLFGLPDSTTDPLSDGAKFGDAADQFIRWRIRGADPDRSTDAEGLIHLSVSSTGGAFVVSAHADAARTRLVAEGARATSEGRVRLRSRNGSGLSGDVELRYTADAADASIAVAPLVLTWRLRCLRSSWVAEDWPAAAPGAAESGSETPLALVDPQTIGLGDLRNPVPGAPAFDLWVARTKELSDRRAGLVSARDAAADPAAAIDAVVSLALTIPGDPVSVTRLTEIDEAEQHGERIGTRLADIGLTAPGFRLLMPVVTLAQSGVALSPPEWELLLDTLVVARKRRDVDAWRDGERILGITLSPNYFRLGSEDLAPDDARRVDLPVWLSTREQRRRWSEVLSARIDQEANVTAGVRRGVDTTGEQTLPMLRDALIVASDAEGSDGAGMAEWLTRRLLVDMRTSGNKRTTRVAQAMETLQELMTRLRTGQLSDDRPSAGLASIASVATQDGRTHLLARDGRGDLWHRVWDGRWHSWRNRGPLPTVPGLPPSEVAAAARGDGFDIAVVAGSRQLWVRRFERQWGEWQAVPGAPELTGSPALASSGPDALDAYVQRIGDLQVHRRQWDGTAWSPSEDTGAASHRAPAAVSRTAATADVIVTLPAAALFGPVHRSWDGLTWTDENLDGSLAGDPVLVAPDDRLELYQNRAGHLYRKVFDGSWQPWEDLDPGLAPTDPQLVHTPAVCVPAPDVVTVYGLRVDKFGAQLSFRRLEGGVWSAWEQLPDDAIELDAIQFDAEWEWVGSHPSLRSATFVRLYPENLLLPSLVPRQTPAFRALVAGSRPTQRLTESRACSLARTYVAYLRDVSLLTVQSSCHAVVTVGSADPCVSGAPVQRGVKLMFGLAPSGTVYWSSYDFSQADSGYGQSFWQAVQLDGDGGGATATTVRRIVGAIPWVNAGDGQHHLHLFLEVSVPGGRVLKRASVDLNSLGDPSAWSGGLEDVELPTGYGGMVLGLNSVTVLPVQSQNTTEAPRLAFHDPTTATVYIRPLSPTGGFVAGPWSNFTITPRINKGDLDFEQGVGRLYAALRVGGRDWIVYWWPDSVKVFVNGPGNRAAAVADGPNMFHGALIGGSSSIFLFHDKDGEKVYAQVSFNQSVAGGIVLGKRYQCPGVSDVVPHSEFAANFFVSPTGTAHVYGRGCRVEGDKLVSSSKFDLKPWFGPSPYIRSKGTVTELQSRRIMVRNTHQDNASGSETILTYLREAFRLVPQQLGLALQAAGHYVAALDWFATVYDHRAPLADRYIDHGLALDAALPAASIIRFPEGWLLDPLNPHAVARTRRGASARYAITTTMGCLNEYADSQFSLDTNESLPIARLLYDAVLQLADVPELRRHEHDCGALVAALEVRPGEAVPPEVAAALGAVAEQLSPGGGQSMLKLTQMVTYAKKGLIEWRVVLPELTEFAKTQQSVAPPPLTPVEVLAASASTRSAVHAALLADAGIERTTLSVGVVGSTIGLPVSLGTGASL